MNANLIVIRTVIPVVLASKWEREEENSEW